MNQMRIYEIEGMTLQIPLRYDERTGIHVEDYREFIENSIYTPTGFPVIFSGEDACPHAEESTPGGCPDCGSCRFYKRPAEHTWIGICRNEKRRVTPKKEAN